MPPSGSSSNASAPPEPTAVDDPFDTLLTLEDQFHTQGYQAGHADGLRQSHLSARLFGIEKGYAKFQEIGRLAATARIWHARLQRPARPSAQTTEDGAVEKGDMLAPLLPASSEQARARLKRHIDALTVLTDPTTLCYENSDEAVSQTDERLKRARAKVLVIRRMIGEHGGVGESLHKDADAPEGETEIADALTKVKMSSKAGNMEDLGLG